MPVRENKDSRGLFLPEMVTQLPLVPSVTKKGPYGSSLNKQVKNMWLAVDGLVTMVPGLMSPGSQFMYFSALHFLEQTTRLPWGQTSNSTPDHQAPAILQDSLLLANRGGRWCEFTLRRRREKNPTQDTSQPGGWELYQTPWPRSSKTSLSFIISLPLLSFLSSAIFY